MLEQQPSRTAFAAAAHRAAHQLLERGAIFKDPLALAILGQDAETVARDAEADPARTGMRAFIAARSHFAEGALAAGVAARGVRQLVVLGAGLDTLAYRHALGDGLRVSRWTIRPPRPGNAAALARPASRSPATWCSRRWTSSAQACSMA